MRVRSLMIAASVCAAVLMAPMGLDAQGNANLPPQARAEATGPDRFDTMPTALRDMFDRPVTTPARGGRDFEPGKPDVTGHTNPGGVDPLAATTDGNPLASALPKAFTEGTAVDPTRRVAPPDTTGDLGPNHYVQWVNLRYAVYNVTRGASNEITGFTLANGIGRAHV